MKKLKMIGRIPQGDSVIDAIAFLNSIDWNISLVKGDENCFIISGEQKIFISDSMESCESFLLGMAISLAVLPESFIKTIKELIGD